MNLLEQFARHLEFLGLGRVSTRDSPGNIFYGTMPPEPERAICVFATDASYPGSIEGARLQVVVRGKNDRDAFETCHEIACEMDLFNGFLAGGLARAIIFVLNGAHGIGTDERKRVLYACNLRVRYCDFDGT